MLIISFHAHSPGEVGYYSQIRKVETEVHIE